MEGLSQQLLYLGYILTVDNSAAPVYTTARVIGVRSSQGPNGEDVVAEETRHAFVAQTPEVFVYDADGNLTSDGRWTYGWDAENRLIEMASVVGQGADLAPRQKLEFAYDCAGRRIRKQVFAWDSGSSLWSPVSDLRFLWAGWNLVAEFSLQDSALQLLRSFTWGLDLSGSAQGAGGVGGLLQVSAFSPSVTSAFPCYDGNGNVLALVDSASGTRVADYEYGPFGEVVKSAGPAAAANPFGFSTKYTDSEIGLLYYGLRYYNPSTGRWLSRDPIGERGGANLYGVVANSPVNHWDYLGLAWMWSPESITNYSIAFDPAMRRAAHGLPVAHLPGTGAAEALAWTLGGLNNLLSQHYLHGLGGVYDLTGSALMQGEVEAALSAGMRREHGAIIGQVEGFVCPKSEGLFGISFHTIGDTAYSSIWRTHFTSSVWVIRATDAGFRKKTNAIIMCRCRKAVGAAVTSSFKMYFYDRFADAADVPHVIPGAQEWRGGTQFDEIGAWGRNVEQLGINL